MSVGSIARFGSGSYVNSAISTWWTLYLHPLNISVDRPVAVTLISRLRHKGFLFDGRQFLNLHKIILAVD